MKYQNICHGIFLERPNRFTAQVLLIGSAGESADDIETVHVKNTGSCRGLLEKGNRVVLTKSDNPNRKTKYDLVAVYQNNERLYNIDSQAPNKVAMEWLSSQDFDLVHPEHPYGKSRIDFYMKRGSERYLMEVKGVTLVRDGQAYFPDAHSQRAIKHVKELMKANEEGYHAVICFVIQTEGPTSVLPEEEISPKFAEVYQEAIASGVKAMVLACQVTEESLEYTTVFVNITSRV